MVQPILQKYVVREEQMQEVGMQKLEEWTRELCLEKRKRVRPIEWGGEMGEKEDKQM